MVERADAERAEEDLVEPLLERVPQIERISRAAALCSEDSDARVAEPLRREGEESPRRRVEPLDVVDRHEHGNVTRQCP